MSDSEYTKDALSFTSSEITCYVGFSCSCDNIDKNSLINGYTSRSCSGNLKVFLYLEGFADSINPDKGGLCFSITVRAGLSVFSS